jgi:hypothetical protein
MASPLEAAAASLAETYDDTGLVVLLAMRANAIDADPALQDDLALFPSYDDPGMGALEDLKGMGWRLLRRWNLELQQLVCGSADAGAREQLARALSLGDGTAVGIVITVLLALQAPPALAVIIAPIVVRRILIPGRDELCAAWKEAIDAPP